MPKPKIQIIVGSTRPNRIGGNVAEWLYSLAAKQLDADFEIVDLADIKLPLLDEPFPARAGQYQNQHTLRWSEKVQEADGFVFITPEYNHGYSAVLKNALDYLYHEWAGKPVAIVSYGIQPGGGSRASGQLRQVVEELHMLTLPNDINLQLDRSIVFMRGDVTDSLATQSESTLNVLQQLENAVTSKVLS